MQKLFRKVYTTKLGLSSLRSLLQASGSNNTGSTRSWSKIQTAVSENVSQATGPVPSMEIPLREDQQDYYELNHVTKPNKEVLHKTIGVV